MARAKGKNTDKMCQLIFLNIYPQQQKQWRKSPLYIYWECQTIYSTLNLKLHNTHLLHLFVDMYVSKLFFKKKHDFARLIFAFKKIQEMGIKSLFLSFQKSFSVVIFQYLKSHLTKIVHWPHYGIIIESSICWENWNGHTTEIRTLGGNFSKLL